MMERHTMQMQKRVSPDEQNALDNAGNSRATGGGPDHPKA